MPYEIRKVSCIVAGRSTVTGVSAAQAAAGHKTAGVARRLRISTSPFPFICRKESTTKHTKHTKNQKIKTDRGKLGRSTKMR